MYASVKRVLIIVILLVIGLTLIGLGIRDYNVTAALDKDGVPVQGFVQGGREKRGRRGGRTYTLDVLYGPKGAERQKSFTVSKEIYGTAGQSREVTVQYLPSDPTVARIGKGSGHWIMLVFGTGLTLAGVVMTLVGLKGASDAKATTYAPPANYTPPGYNPISAAPLPPLPHFPPRRPRRAGASELRQL